MANTLGTSQRGRGHDSRPRVSVVIPVLNEERNLPHVAARMPDDVDEIVVVDGRSTDRTVEVARRLWPDGVHLTQTRTGKGNALACGIAAATGDIIVILDGDGSTDPAEIPAFVGALLAGAEFAKGSRFIQGGGSADITRFRRLGNWGLKLVVNGLFRTHYTDLCYGFNAFWRQSLGKIKLPDLVGNTKQWGDGFEIETLINLRVCGAGLKIVEVCSFEHHRLHGVSNLNAVRDGLRVLHIISREYFGERPQRLSAGQVNGGGQTEMVGPGHPDGVRPGGGGLVGEDVVDPDQGRDTAVGRPGPDRPGPRLVCGVGEPAAQEPAKRLHVMGAVEVPGDDHGALAC